jgi:GDP-L-fucose synthase
VLAAAKVGGIVANWEQPYEFIAVNLAIELNVIDAAFRAGVPRLVFLGSSCIYPREAPQPLREEYLLTGPLEETNRPYALAKIAGIELCRSLNREYGTDYLSLMPTNLYGPGDNYDLRTSHVLPALIRKFHEARLGLPGADGAPRPPQSPVVLWGRGTPLRELMHVDDVAEAIVFALEKVSAAAVPDALLNVGVGRDQTIGELAALVQRIVGHEGPIVWDTSKPDGTPKKQLDVGRLLALGWRPTISLEDGVRSTYRWYVENCTAPDGSFIGGRVGAA